MSDCAGADDRDDRLRRALLAIRQAFYSAADELGRLYDLERPCKRCEQERRRPRLPQELRSGPERAA